LAEAASAVPGLERRVADLETRVEALTAHVCKGYFEGWEGPPPPPPPWFSIEELVRQADITEEDINPPY
jgi:hypothetical protein